MGTFYTEYFSVHIRDDVSSLWGKIGSGEIPICMSGLAI